MFWIRKNSILLAACMSVMIGCAHRQDSPPVVNTDPIQPDEAMQRRDWAQATAIYPNGAVAAGPTEFNYEPKRGMAEWKYNYADSGTFFGSTPSFVSTSSMRSGGILDGSMLALSSTWSIIPFSCSAMA